MAGRTLAAAFAALAVACDPQADTSYPGEPLIELHGRVASAGPTPLEAAMLWQRGPPPSYDDVELATRAPVVAGFPATFTLRLYQPPPAAARRALADGEVSYARANAAAVPYGIAASSVGALPSVAGGAGFGIDAAHWVVYVADPVPPGSLTAWWLGGALPRGYALLRVTSGCPSAAELDACVAELQRRGVPEDGTGRQGTADGYCRAPYRLAPAPDGEEIVLELGTAAAASPGAPCP